MDSIAEVWKTVPGYEGQYEVSNQGSVRSLDRIIHMTRNGLTYPRFFQGQLLNAAIIGGYRIVDLAGKHISVHRLVAWAFIGPQEQGMCVNHINGIKTDNRPENLEYVTKGDNNRHAGRTGLMAFGERHSQAKLTEEQVRLILSMPQESNKSMAAIVGTTPRNIRLIRSGKRWRRISALAGA